MRRLLPDIPNNFVNIPDFNVFRYDKGRGGGVCIYVKDNLKVESITLNIDRHPQIEDLWITVQSHKFPSFIIGCVYRHPHASHDSFDYLSEIFKFICLKKKSVLALGDLNDDMLDSGNKIGHIIRNNSLTQLVTKPTRITTTSSTLIDLIITNNLEIVRHSDVLPCHVADHELITLVINVKKEKRPPVTKTFRSLAGYTPDQLCNLLLTKSSFLNTILDTDEVNIQVLIFTNIFNECLDACAPLVTREIKRPPAPWIDSELKDAMKFRDEIHRKLKIDKGNNVLEGNYKSEKNVSKKCYQVKRINIM